MRRLQVPRAPFEIGLLNNMPDAALHATERQFAGLLKAAAGDHEVRLRFFSLPEVPRGDFTRAYMRGIYEGPAEMFAAGLDGLIVTGAEPLAADLADEPYWAAMTQVIDWAETQVGASYWSCLAAHAAVLHLDGLRRVPLAAKCSGVFDSEPVDEDPLLARFPARIRTPHSRLNGVDEEALRDHGYQVLTRSADAGVDTFVRRGSSLMVFCQGHPEYDADTLLKEYSRDAGRFLCGRRGAQPTVPTGYLNRKTERAFAAVARRKPDPALMERYKSIVVTSTPRQVWRPSAVALFRNWLHEISANKTARASAVGKAERQDPLTAGA